LVDKDPQPGHCLMYSNPLILINIVFGVCGLPQLATLIL